MATCCSTRSRVRCWVRSEPEILARVVERMRARGLRLGNLDATVIAQQPRLAPHVEKMERALADQLGADPDRINVKVTSTDGLGAIGAGEGIAALAVLLLEETRPDEKRSGEKHSGEKE